MAVSRKGPSREGRLARFVRQPDEASFGSADPIVLEAVLGAGMTDNAPPGESGARGLPVQPIAQGVGLASRLPPLSRGRSTALGRGRTDGVGNTGVHSGTIANAEPIMGTTFGAGEWRYPASGTASNGVAVFERDWSMGIAARSDTVEG